LEEAGLERTEIYPVQFEGMEWERVGWVLVELEHLLKT
jgi:hypothetical protein